jgi:hypothetical protein
MRSSHSKHCSYDFVYVSMFVQSYLLLTSIIITVYFCYHVYVFLSYVLYIYVSYFVKYMLAILYVLAILSHIL